MHSGSGSMSRLVRMSHSHTCPIDQNFVQAVCPIGPSSVQAGSNISMVVEVSETDWRNCQDLWIDGIRAPSATAGQIIDP